MQEAIPLIVDIPAGMDSGIWPVTTGVPFPDNDESGLSESEAVCVHYDSLPLPTQTKVSANWPSGRVRWLLVDFQVDTAVWSHQQYDTPVEAVEGSPFTLRPGDSPAPEGALEVLISDQNERRIALGKPGRYVSISGAGELLVRFGSTVKDDRWATVLDGSLGFQLESGGARLSGTRRLDGD